MKKKGNPSPSVFRSSPKPKTKNQKPKKTFSAVSPPRIIFFIKKTHRSDREKAARHFPSALQAPQPAPPHLSRVTHNSNMDPLAPSITFFDKETGKGRVTYIGTFFSHKKKNSPSSEK